MKNTVLSVWLLFFLLHPLFAQDTFYLEEYDSLQPEINVLATYFSENTIVERELLIYPPALRTEPLFVCDMPAGTMRLLSAGQMGKEQSHMLNQFFWDPHTRKNYMYCKDSSNSSNGERGWHLLTFSDNFLSFHLQNRYQYWANHSSPSVQLDSTNIFTAQYEINQWNSRVNPKGHLTAYKSSFKITDTASNKAIWELTTETDHLVNLYWVTEQWFFRQNRYFFAIGEAERQNTVSNYKTGETNSFAPECIIGYGNGVVLTSTETDAGFIGITIWTPEKDILYSDRTFSLSGIIDREHGQITWGRPSITVSYFDYPYIYCNIGRGRGNYPPYGTLIMNVLNGKTYFTPYGYHLFGIFEP